MRFSDLKLLPPVQQYLLNFVFCMAIDKVLEKFGIISLRAGVQEVLAKYEAKRSENIADHKKLISWFQSYPYTVFFG